MEARADLLAIARAQGSLQMTLTIQPAAVNHFAGLGKSTPGALLRTAEGGSSGCRLTL